MIQRNLGFTRVIFEGFSLKSIQRLDEERKGSCYLHKENGYYFLSTLRHNAMITCCIPAPDFGHSWVTIGADRNMVLWTAKEVRIDY